MALVVAAISPAGSAALGLHRVKLNAYEAEGLFRTAALALFAALAVRPRPGLRDMRCPNPPSCFSR